MRRIDPTGKLAIVTGASSGIGLEFCHDLARRGCNLLMVSNQEKELGQAAREIGVKYQVEVSWLTLDLTLPGAAATLAMFCRDNRFDPEILINNAGIFNFRMFTEMDPGRIGLFLDLHVRAVTELCHTFGRRFAERGSGRILNMSSMSCWMPMPGLSMYSATKAYIRVFSRSLHYELRESGVGVTVACPGGIATDLFGLPGNLKRLAVKIGVLQTPQKFARKAVDRLLKGREQYINGCLNRISILAVGSTPRAVRMQVKHRLLDRGITR